MRKHGGKIWRITRYPEAVDAHSSETLMEWINADETLVNCGTLQQLNQMVFEVYNKHFP